MCVIATFSEASRCFSASMSFCESEKKNQAIYDDEDRSASPRPITISAAFIAEQYHTITRVGLIVTACRKQHGV